MKVKGFKMLMLNTLASMHKLGPVKIGRGEDFTLDTFASSDATACHDSEYQRGLEVPELFLLCKNAD